MTVGVLALQGDVREHAAALAALGEQVRLVRAPGRPRRRSTGLVLPGGESTTLSLLLDSSGLFGPLADALRHGLPVFGTCAGMILLATDVLDGRRDQGSFGRDRPDRPPQRVRPPARPRSSAISTSLGLDGEPVHAVFIRAPVVERAGAGRRGAGHACRAPAEPALGPAAGASCRQGPVLVSSFHPELTGDRRLHQLFVAMMGQP